MAAVALKVISHGCWSLVPACWMVGVWVVGGVIVMGWSGAWLNQSRSDGSKGMVMASKIAAIVANLAKVPNWPDFRRVGSSPEVRNQGSLEPYQEPD